MNNHSMIFAVLALVSSNVSLARMVEGNEKEKIFHAVVEKQAELGLCSEGDDLTQNVERSNVYARDQSQYLVSVLCFNAAYQGNYEFVYVDATQTPMKIQGADLSLAGYPTFDPVTSILTNGYKFTGAGTCFQNSSYYWDGSVLKLISSTLVDGVENGCEALGVRSPATDRLITAKSVGLAQLGMTFGELKRLLPKDSQFKTMPLGVDLPVGMQVSFEGEAQFSLGFDNLDPETFQERPLTDQSKITMIMVSNPQYRTTAEVGPGTPLKAAIAKYGAATLSYNTEAESRESIEFANSPFSDTGESRVWFRSNQWTVTDFAGIYPNNQNTYQRTQKYHDHGAIGAIWIMEQKIN